MALLSSRGFASLFICVVPDLAISDKKVSRSLLIETGGALRLPCLDIMCNLLVDLNRQDAEVIFFFSLSIRH